MVCGISSNLEFPGCLQLRSECQKVLKMNLFSTHFSKSAKLEEFEQSQLQACDHVGNYLRDTWSTAVRNAVRNSFKDVGKGWFHLQETNRETYEFSKLRKFNNMTRLMMEDVLRFLLEDSLQKFCDCLQACAACKVWLPSVSVNAR